MAKSKAGAKQKSKQRIGPENGRWKNGRVTQNGYTKIRKPGHPLADSSDYVYEHRLKTGAKPGTQVHHRDEDRKNNSPDNLKVEGSLAEHNRERAGKKKDDKKPPAKKKPAKKPDKK